FIGFTRYFFSVKTNRRTYNKYILFTNPGPFFKCVSDSKASSKGAYTNYYYKSEGKGYSLCKGIYIIFFKIFYYNYLL
ncbi:uncharacterized protein B0T23DRAFT_285480, partial [Neurospora hispaniola]